MQNKQLGNWINFLVDKTFVVEKEKQIGIRLEHKNIGETNMIWVNKKYVKEVKNNPKKIRVGIYTAFEYNVFEYKYKKQNKFYGAYIAWNDIDNIYVLPNTNELESKWEIDLK